MPLHPVLVAMAEEAEASGAPDMADGTPADVREWLLSMRAALGDGPQIGAIKPVTIDTREGNIPGRIYMPISDPIGLMVYLHGGGWVAGALDDFDTLARQLADRSDCAVLVVDYRLAPEAAFPAGLNDCVDAIKWSSENLAELVGNKLPLIVAGESAGGNLAAVACNVLRRDVDILAQILLYPVTGTDFDTQSYKDNENGPILTREAMKWFFGHYVSTTLMNDENVAPIKANLKGVAPALILTAEYDVLRNDGEFYANRLRDHGVDVELRQIDGLAHGFSIFANLIDTASDALDFVAKNVKDRISTANNNQQKSMQSMDIPPVGSS